MKGTGNYEKLKSSSVLFVCHSLKILLTNLAEILVESTETLHTKS